MNKSSSNNNNNNNNNGNNNEKISKTIGFCGTNIRDLANFILFRAI